MDGYFGGPEGFAGIGAEGFFSYDFQVEEMPRRVNARKEVDGQADGEVVADEMGDGVSGDDEGDLGAACGEGEGLAGAEVYFVEMDGVAEGAEGGGAVVVIADAGTAGDEEEILITLG